MENAIEIQISKLVIVVIAVVFVSSMMLTSLCTFRLQRQRRHDMLRSLKLTRSAKLR